MPILLLFLIFESINYCGAVLTDNSPAVLHCCSKIMKRYSWQNGCRHAQLIGFLQEEITQYNNVPGVPWEVQFLIAVVNKIGKIGCLDRKVPWDLS